MRLVPRSPITRLLTAACYGAVAIFGQGLHLLACHDHDHVAEHCQATEHGHAEHCQAEHDHLVGRQGVENCDSQNAQTAIASRHVDEHDADQCPICQYHSQGQWHGMGERDARSAALESPVPHHVRSFRRRPIDRPLGPRGPPSSSANLA